MSFRLKLPATSANLGPGFDAAGLAMSTYLYVDAEAAPEFSLLARGRDHERCGWLHRNLILDTYRSVLSDAHQPVQPISLHLQNEIPLGMGCGSSASALLAGVALADHFGSLHLGDTGIVAEASRREGHPDNVAACWYGGFTISALTDSGVQAASFPGDPTWRLVLALQPTSLPTREARALLPDTYSRADAVFNLQRSALLTAAFAQSRLDLLATAMQDRLHQPFRQEACPLLKSLLPLNGQPGIAGVALSGAGPSVLIILASNADEEEVKTRIRSLTAPSTELMSLRIAPGVSSSPA